MFIPLLEKRRSVRKYLDRPIEPEKVRHLVEAALLAPSSRGFNPWQFVVVDDGDLLKALSGAKPHGATFLRGAALGIVVCGDPDKSDVWIEDTAIAAILLHLTAASLDLGSCWIQIRERMHDGSRSAQDYVRQLLEIPENLAVTAIIAVGYPDEDKPPRSRTRLQFEKVHRNRFGAQWQW